MGKRKLKFSNQKNFERKRQAVYRRSGRPRKMKRPVVSINAASSSKLSEIDETELIVHIPVSVYYDVNVFDCKNLQGRLEKVLMPEGNKPK